jgi:hypothetical protein
MKSDLTTHLANVSRSNDHIREQTGSMAVTVQNIGEIATDHNFQNAASIIEAAQNICNSYFVSIKAKRQEIG